MQNSVAQDYRSRDRHRGVVGDPRGRLSEATLEFVVDGKEALAFALLGLQRALDLPNAEGSWTGASSPSVGGALWGTFPAAGRRRD